MRSRSVEKLVFLTKPQLISSRAVFPGCLGLEIYGILAWRRSSSSKKLRFRLQSSRASKPFILRPSPFRLPYSTIFQLSLPITKLPCQNSNSDASL